MGAMQLGERPVEGAHDVVEDALGVELGGGAVAEHRGDQLEGRLHVVRRAAVGRIEAGLVVVAGQPLRLDPPVSGLDAEEVGVVLVSSRLLPPGRFDGTARAPRAGEAMGKAEGSRAKPVKAERLAAAFPVAFETARGATSQQTKWPGGSMADRRHDRPLTAMIDVAT